MPSILSGRLLCALYLPLIGLSLILGCGDKSKVGKVVPVSGKVALGTDPLPGGLVTFHPDTAKGNTSKFLPFGPIKDGAYTLQTLETKGAPPGWYKVTVSSMAPPGAGATTPGDMPQGPKLNTKYVAPTTTDLSIEVVDAPAAGAYDLILAK